jgi:hypothetical protein
MTEEAPLNLQAYASQVTDLMDKFRLAYSTLSLDRSERNYVATTLLASSLDTLWSCATLVGSGHIASRYPSLALYRTALDNMLRGAFFGRIATQAELLHFRDRGSMPTRAKEGVADARLTPRRLAKMIEYAYAVPQLALEPGTTEKWGSFSALTHGGSPVVRMYVKEDGSIACRIEDDILIWHLQQCLVLSAFVLGFAVELSRESTEAFNERSEDLMTRVHDAVQAAKRHLAMEDARVRIDDDLPCQAQEDQCDKH